MGIMKSSNAKNAQVLKEMIAEVEAKIVNKMMEDPTVPLWQDRTQVFFALLSYQEEGKRISDRDEYPIAEPFRYNEKGNLEDRVVADYRDDTETVGGSCSAISMYTI